MSSLRRPGLVRANVQQRFGKAVHSFGDEFWMLELMRTELVHERIVCGPPLVGRPLMFQTSRAACMAQAAKFLAAIQAIAREAIDPSAAALIRESFDSTVVRLSLECYPVFKHTYRRNSDGRAEADFNCR